MSRHQAWIERAAMLASYSVLAACAWLVYHHEAVAAWSAIWLPH